MAECSVDTLIADGKCFSGACLTPDQQRVAMLQLLCQISETASGGGVTSITAGTGIVVSSPTGAVTIRFTPSQYTTAQLLALSSSDSAAIGVAYCTDCLTTKGLLTDVGDFVFWNGIAWISSYSGIEITTSLPLFSLRLFIKYPGVSTFPGGPMNWAGLAGQNLVSGAGSTTGSDATPTGDGRIATRVASTGTTSTGAARRVFQGFVPNPSNSQSRHITLVQGYNFVDVSAAPDTWHYRDSIETFQNTATAAIQNDMCALVYDQSNILGFGSTGSDRFALVRANGTTFDWIDTGVVAANPHYVVTTAELTGVNTVRMRIATALSGGSSFQVVADRTVTVSGAALQPCFALQKATGTTAKLAGMQNNHVCMAIKANSTPATTVLS